MLTWTGLSNRATAIALRARQSQFRMKSTDSKDNSAKQSSAPAEQKQAEQPNPVLEEYLRKHPQKPEEDIDVQKIRPETGRLASDSIFEEAETQLQPATQDDKSTVAEISTFQQQFPTRTLVNMERILDPVPASRMRWERKKVIQAFRRSGRVSKEVLIKRTEREHLAKSENMKTSVKKLGMLARQIAGKTLADAIAQMQFSKKKVAKTVREHLETARDEAVVMRGMGLGDVKAAGEAAEEAAPSKAIQIRLKDGKKYQVSDPSEIYIAQAWVGRGPYGQLPDYRARGRVFIMRTPWTSLTVILKEDKTRVREYNDREAKRLKQRRKNLWTQLPDRPLQGPRGQYYCW